MKRFVIVVLAAAMCPLGAPSLASAQVEEDETLYCLREGFPPDQPLDELECIVVDQIEDVPEGARWAPTHGGLDDPEEIRRSWCLPIHDDEIPPPDQVEERCLRFFAEEYGGEYAEILAANRAGIEPEPSLRALESTELSGRVLDMPGIQVEATGGTISLRMPGLSLSPVPV